MLDKFLSAFKQAPPVRNIEDRRKLLALREEQFREAAGRLAERVFSGEISVEEWQRAMKAEVKDLLTTATIAGAGGDSRLVGPAEWGATGARCKLEYGLLRNYAAEIEKRQADGTLTLAYVKARSDLYGGAARHPFERAKTASEVHEYYAWRRNVRGFSAEHCGDCDRRENEWTKVHRDAIKNWPGDLSTKCGCNCNCGWVPVE